jgi:SAM-dependent methyltransferase
MPDIDFPHNETWFEDHFDVAAQEIVDSFASIHLSLEGKRVADIGTGDGIISLGLFQRARPEILVGYDIQDIDEDALAATAAQHGIAALPNGLRFVRSFPDHIPAESGSFDYVVSWSAFEHVSDPAAMASEIRRILVPGGVAMIQVFPFYYSEHGDHGWARPPFAHLITGTDRSDAQLNRITFDELHAALRKGGLRTAKVELIHNSFIVPPELVTFRLSDLAIGGAKLLAVSE